MAKWTRVMNTMTIQGLFFSRSAKSCFGELFFSVTGWMRSRVVKNVMRKRIKHSTAQTVIVICHPCCRSLPTAKRATSGKVSPPTMNWAMWREVEAIVRDADVRPILAVIPDNRDPSFRYGDPATDFWGRVRAWQASGWTIGLHGYQHLYVSDGRGVCGTDPRSEFAGVARGEQERKLLSLIHI